MYIKLKTNIKVNEPNANGTIYTREAIENGLKKRVPVQVDSNKKVVGIVDDFEFNKQNELILDILAVPNNYLLNTLATDETSSLSIESKFTIDKDNNFDKLISCSVVPKPTYNKEVIIDE